MSVHPHVHGELSVSVVPRVVSIGSSPRAWGTLNADVAGDGIGRFIPTCMGNSSLR